MRGGLKIWDWRMENGESGVRVLELDLGGLVLQVARLLPLVSGAFHLPVGSGWMRLALAVDVFALSVKIWHDEGEASHLS